MTRIDRHSIFLPMLAAVALTASSAGIAQTPAPKDALKMATDRANAIKAATGAKPTATRLPPGDPCAVLTPALVQSAFTGVKAGEDTKRLEEYGIKECQWKNGSGDVMLVLKDSYDHATNAKEDALGMADLYSGMKGAKNVRIETYPSLGVDNAAFVEDKGAEHGLPNGGAFLEVRKGEHNITLGAPGFVGRDRSQVLKTFEAMGRQAASHL